MENNRCGGDFGGGGYLEGQGLFTWNLVQNNQANLLSTYGYGGGLDMGGGPVELSRNSYSLNECENGGGGILLGSGITTVLRHELVYGIATLRIAVAPGFMQCRPPG